MPGASFSRAQLDALKRQSDLVAVVREQGIVLRRRGRTLCLSRSPPTANSHISTR